MAVGEVSVDPDRYRALLRKVRRELGIVKDAHTDTEASGCKFVKECDGGRYAQPQHCQFEQQSCVRSTGDPAGFARRLFRMKIALRRTLFAPKAGLRATLDQDHRLARFNIRKDGLDEIAGSASRSRQNAPYASTSYRAASDAPPGT